MTRYIVVSIVGGFLFGVMDVAVNANSLATRMFAVYQPIAKTPVNAPAGVAIDLAYGFVMAGLFVVLYAGLPGHTGVIKGVTFGLIAWFFRVVMSVASSWMMFNVPASALVYLLVSGLVEMLVLGILFGMTLR